jgi:hypothetical protein
MICAAVDARFGFPEIKIGMPISIERYSLPPSIVGFRKDVVMEIRGSFDAYARMRLIMYLAQGPYLEREAHNV